MPANRSAVAPAPPNGEQGCRARVAPCRASPGPAPPHRTPPTAQRSAPRLPSDFDPTTDTM
eukprot:661375-Prymnesium_polylepis.1